MENQLTSFISGTGQQGSVSCFSIFTYYAIGIPLSYILGFKIGWGLSGLLYGSLAPSMICLTTNGIIIARIDWPVLLKEVAERV